MKKIAIATLVTLTSTLSGIAQEKPRLRVGYAQKPEEAAAELKGIRDACPDLAAWERRRGRIRAGILRGAGLDSVWD